jgi:3',5'-cyclic AMP phosphodiesterase CpdA
MRTVVHLSDLHFGRVDDAILSPLINTVHEIGPDVVVVSGDLTQRARTHELKAARRFLDALPSPQIVVPGNHDVPFHDLTRLFSPLSRYRRYVHVDPEPFFLDDELAIVGLNTARGMALIGGWLDEHQLHHAKSRFDGVDGKIAKIIVTHHPLDAPDPRHSIAGKSARAMHAFAAMGVDLLLSGHLHRSHAGHAAERYVVDGRQMLLAHAGTATSTRVRGEANAFNVIRIERERICVERRTWTNDSFSTSAFDEFSRSAPTPVNSFQNM